MNFFFLFLFLASQPMPLQPVATVTPRPVIYSVAPTGSMKPLFDENYFLYAESRPFQGVEVGDIIIYKTKLPQRYRCELIVHKVIARSSRGGVLICKGVNNKKSDAELITEDMYVATVVKWVTREEYFK